MLKYNIIYKYILAINSFKVKLIMNLEHQDK